MTPTERQSVARLLEKLAGYSTQLATAIDLVHDEVLRRAADDRQDSPKRAPDMHKCIESTLAGLTESGSPIYGLGFIASPLRTEGDSGIQWWYKADRGPGFRRLLVGTDPARLDFYDYPETPWFRSTLNDDSLHVTSPYVDYSGTNRYVVTLSRRVQLGDQFFGIAGADIVVGDLQACLQRQLLDLPRASFIIDHDGAVIATNSAQFLGANRSMPLDNERAYDIPGLPWQLVVPLAKSRRKRAAA